MTSCGSSSIRVRPAGPVPLGVDPHAAQLPDEKRFAVAADPLLAEKDRPTVLELDGEGGDQEQRRGERQTERRQDEVEETFADRVELPVTEAVVEDEPTRLQPFEIDAARLPLVEVVVFADRDTGQSAAEQGPHRQPAPPFDRGYDDLVRTRLPTCVEQPFVVVGSVADRVEGDHPNGTERREAQPSLASPQIVERSRITEHEDAPAQRVAIDEPEEQPTHEEDQGETRRHRDHEPRPPDLEVGERVEGHGQQDEAAREGGQQPDHHDPQVADRRPLVEADGEQARHHQGDVGERGGQVRLQFRSEKLDFGIARKVSKIKRGEHHGSFGQPQSKKPQLDVMPKNTHGYPECGPPDFSMVPS